MTVISVFSGSATDASAVSRAPAAARPIPANSPKPGDFGADAAKSADVALDGWGDAQGYHLQLGRENAGFAWREVALIHPAGLDDSSWTGYQCLSGDGRYAAVAILPVSAVTKQAARDHGAFAYAVDLTSGVVRPLATGKIDGSVTAPGQITSGVPTAAGIVGAAGSQLVSVPAKGKPVTVATVAGDAYDLRPAADGGVSFLQHKAGEKTATAAHEHDGKVTKLGSGALTHVQLFQGRAGHAVLSGASQADLAALTASAVTGVKDAGLAHGATASSLDGDALFGADDDTGKTASKLLSTKTGNVLARDVAASNAKPVTTIPSYRAATVTAAPKVSAGKLAPSADAAPATTSASQSTTTTQTPTCAVAPLDTAKQVMQPSPAQVDWAVQLAEQGLLTGSAYTRPAGFDNLGLAAYAPNSDFPLIPLSHPSGASNTVPRSIFEGIMAQESNWSQASWHAPAGTAGDPLIASYYGAGGDIRSINYAGADCGYGISQVTDGMHVGDHSLSAHGQIKVAVDYQENIAAGLQILETTWNSLYIDGIIANNGDPSDLENWYFAAQIGARE